MVTVQELLFSSRLQPQLVLEDEVVVVVVMMVVGEEVEISRWWWVGKGDI